MTPSIIAWMSAIQGLIAVAPDVILFAAKVKGWIADMFLSGVITAETQDAMNMRVNEICRAVMSDELPEHWKVEADPE